MNSNINLDSAPPSNTLSLPLDHVAIIMDGNRRWANINKVPLLLGHRQGVQSLKRLVKHVSNYGLKYLTVYAFSSENWQREQKEVDYLLNLFAEVLSLELPELDQAGIRLRFIGKLTDMPTSLQESFVKAEKKTAVNKGLNLQVAINYGSRLEITEAVKCILQDIQQGSVSITDINPDLISSYLYTKGLPDPDLIIRTGGEMRLSNYLLWQAAYTELYVTQVLWPEFDEAQFNQAIEEFSTRQRRWGS